METDTKLVLTKARELIADPDNWTQGEYARDARWRSVNPLHPEAVRWCAWGAMCRAKNTLAVDYDMGAFGRLAPRGGSILSALMNFNDNSTHAEVLDLFDTAIGSV